MARGHSNDGHENGSLIDRRSYLKLASTAGAVAAAAVGGSITAASQAADTSEVVNLGDVGLSEGDVIDPYFEEYFRNGTEVRVPAGEYDWRGGGLHFGASRDAAIVGEGEVILNAVEQDHNNTIIADGGTLEFRNLTIRGKVDDGRIRLETERDDDYVLVENVNFPDGAVDGQGRAICFYVPPNHSGVIEFRNCYIYGFSDNGIYASSPGKGDGGQIVIDRCVAHNNNISGFRIGGRGSTVRNSVIINDDTAPVPSGISHNQRGIRIDNSEHNKDMEIRNVDVIHSGSNSTLGNGGPIRITDRARNSTGHIENVRVLNNVEDVPAIFPNDQYADGWTGTNIHVTGNGDLRVPSWFTNVSTGADAEEPTPSTEDLPEGEALDGTELVIVTDESDGIEYEFTTTGRIAPQYYRSEYRANDDDLGESAEENDDGTWTATGATSGSSHSGDTFVYEGELVSSQVDGDVDAMTVYREGTDVTQEFLDADGSGFDDSTGGDGSDGSDGSDSGNDGSDGSDSGNDGSDGSEDSSGDESSGSADQAHELVILTEESDGFEYEFTTEGEVVPLYERSEYRADEGDLGESAEENDDGTWTGTGAMSGSSSSGDAFTYHGDVLAFEVDGDADAMTLHRDGEVVTLEDLVVEDASGEPDDGSAEDGSEDDTDGASGELSNLLIVDGTQSDDVTTYQFAVTGEVERDAALSTMPGDDAGVDARVEDTVGNSEVDGIVGKGVDGYRYSGSLVDFEFSGVATLTIESASE